MEPRCCRPRPDPHTAENDRCPHSDCGPVRGRSLCCGREPFCHLAAYLLGEAYANACEACPWLFSPQRLTQLAQALDADPDLLEEAWTFWTWEMSTWSEAAIMEARSWVDAVLIGGLPIPE